MPPAKETKPLPKGILRKEGKTYAKKSLVWTENLIAPEPAKLSTPLTYTDTYANDLEQENFRQVWREVSGKKLHNAARKIQEFAREYMLCWILTNDRRTELYEELDYIQERLQSDLEWLGWEKEDMYKDADLEIQAERENAPPEEVNQVKADIEIIKELQAEIRNVKADNEKVREDSRKLKKENKQLGYDLKEKAPAVEMSKSKLENIKKNHRQIKANHDQYPPNIQKWIDSIEQIDAQVKVCQWQGNLYRDCVLKVVDEVQLRYPRKRILNPIREILKEEFAQHHPMPDIDMEAAKERRKSAVSPKSNVAKPNMRRANSAAEARSSQAAVLQDFQQDRMEMSERLASTGTRSVDGVVDTSDSCTERFDASESAIHEVPEEEAGEADHENSSGNIMETVEEEEKEAQATVNDNGGVAEGEKDSKSTDEKPDSTEETSQSPAEPTSTDSSGTAVPETGEPKSDGAGEESAQGIASGESVEQMADKESAPNDDETAEPGESAEPENGVAQKDMKKESKKESKKHKKHKKSSSSKDIKKDSLRGSSHKKKTSSHSSHKKKKKHKDKEKDIEEDKELEAVDEFGGDDTETEAEGEDSVPQVETPEPGAESKEETDQSDPSPKEGVTQPDAVPKEETKQPEDSLGTLQSEKVEA